MQKPNWFDTKHADAMAKATPEQILAAVAKDSRVIEAVKEAIDRQDEAIKRKVMGPSRTQVIRKAIAEVLNAD